MSSSFALPASVVARFRAVNFERLERVERAWTALTQGSSDDKSEETLFRELHTLKGDARVVGFVEVGLLCQRLEDLFGAARDRGYRVHEDVDIVATMAIQFLGMLLRRTPGTGGGGIDLDGFLKQIDGVMLEWLRRSSAAPSFHPLAGRPARPSAVSHATPSARERFGGLAAATYLEHLRASGAARTRLRGIYDALVGAIAELAAIPVDAYLAQHAASAIELARELGKTVDVRVEAAGVTANDRVLDALNVAALHILRNAVDHGAEGPGERTGKSAAALVRVTGRVVGDELELRIEDDGRGLDLSRVRARAVEKGLVAADATPTDAELAALIFEARFSTRDSASHVSGRGVGLDAVKAAVEKAGGTITVTSVPNAGTRFVVRLPRAPEALDVHLLRDPRAPLALAVDASWSASTDAGEARCASELLDLPAGDRPSAHAVTVHLRRGALQGALLVAPPVARATASRVCPSAPGDRVEIVTVDGEEALLVRPEILFAR